MELSDALDAARRHSESTLVTLRSDGLPQLSNVVHAVDASGLVRISTTAVGDTTTTSTPGRPSRDEMGRDRVAVRAEICGKQAQVLPEHP